MAPTKKQAAKKQAAKKQVAKKKVEPSQSKPSKLAAYRAKRDFGQTPEPGGSEARDLASSGRRFVVQRHRARRLHYDFRLEVDGVLASWAVPKGPTLDPAARLLAVHAEDHPIEYFDFEGVIPTGEYGGGDVIVWDWGTWEPSNTTDPSTAIAAGELHLDLQGEKLAGRLVLIRRDTKGSGKEQWLLLHKRDEHAVPGWSPEDHPRSVKTGRTNDEVAAAPDAMWRSDLPAADAEVRLPRAPTQSPDTSRWQPVTDAELAALDALGTRGIWDLQGHELSLTNLDKVLFPGRDDQAPVTKRDLVRYHARVAPVMLPYLVDRPVNLHRYPNGVDRPGFWHKEVPSYAPEWLQRWRNPDADPGETEWYAVVDSPAALAWMANYGAVELHPWTSRIGDVRRPTWAFIDIDPGLDTTFDEVLALTHLFRTALVRHQQDARRSLQRPARARCTGLGAARVGRARRPRAASRPLDRRYRVGTHRLRRRPVRSAAGASPGAADAVAVQHHHAHLSRGRRSRCVVFGVMSRRGRATPQSFGLAEER